MTRAITALVALFALKLQACTAFQHSKVQSNRAMNAAPPVRLDWSSAKSATPEIGRFTTKTSRGLADAGAAGTTAHQDHADHARAAAAAAATRAARREVALAGPQATSETLSIDAPTCVMDAALDGLTAAVCRTAADASPTNNYCFTSDVVTESFDATTLTIVANNCPDHVWGQPAHHARHPAGQARNRRPHGQVTGPCRTP